MTYKIIDIQGIGPVYAEKLIGIGIETVDQLLEKGADAKGRQAIEEATGIRHDLVLTWVNHADLFRVKGIGPQFSELLEAAGVDTVKELRNRNAANLAAKLLEVNEEKHLCRRTPVEKEVQKFIDLAKELEPKVTH
jgi:predicted flap endonuclease-1-like 5' DNA nuclease